MDFPQLKEIASFIESVSKVIALTVGGYWTYTRFIRQRDDYAFIEFTVDLNFVGKQDGKWIVELIAYLENKGKVQHTFSDLAFDLEALYDTDGVIPNERYGGQAYFPHQLAKRPWIPPGKYFIEPGLKAKYSYVAQVPQEATFLMLHGRFTYENQPAWHSAERTLEVPRAVADATRSNDRVNVT
jgi:hypothetical protein